MFQTEIKVKGRYVFVSVAGAVTEQSIPQLGTVIRQACEASRVRGALVDCGGMEGALSPGQIFNCTQEFVRNVGPGIRIAYINPPAEWIPDDDEFSRNVAQNRGGSLEIFESSEEAINWLHAHSA